MAPEGVHPLLWSLSGIGLSATVIVMIAVVLRLEHLRTNGRLASGTSTLFSHQGNDPRWGVTGRIYWIWRLIFTKTHQIYGDPWTVGLVYLLRAVLLFTLPAQAAVVTMALI
jgi:hypothetical protein